MTRAYVLITAEPGKIEAMVQQLRQLPGVTAADVVTGSYDVVAVLEQADVQAIGRLIVSQIHGVPGLKTTSTLIAVA